jgi:hypothetical protein
VGENHSKARWKPRASGSTTLSPSPRYFDVALSRAELREARGASRGNAFLVLFDVALSETEIREARGASRGNAFLVLFDVALSETEIREARGASRGNAFRGSNNVISLSLRFGLRSMYFLTDFLLIAANARHQNLRQDRESSGDHWIARQLVPNRIAREGCFGTRRESGLRLTRLCVSV